MGLEWLHTIRHRDLHPRHQPESSDYRDWRGYSPRTFVPKKQGPHFPPVAFSKSLRRLEFKGPAWRQSKKNERHIAALRTRVDGRITELLEVTKAAAYDAGRLAGIIAGKAESAAERTAPVTTEQTPA